MHRKSSVLIGVISVMLVAAVTYGETEQAENLHVSATVTLPDEKKVKLQDGVAFLDKESEKLEVLFFPFTLTEADIAKLKTADVTQIRSFFARNMAKEKSESSLYFLKIRFTNRKGSNQEDRLKVSFSRTGTGHAAGVGSERAHELIKQLNVVEKGQRSKVTLRTAGQISVQGAEYEWQLDASVPLIQKHQGSHD